jgi:predicted metal-dependent peptidase
MLIDALNAPMVRWQDHIRSWADAIVKHDYTWNRPNRRFLGYDFILPSRHSQDELNNLGIIVDTSGSTMPVQKEFASEITGILADGIVQKVTMIDADAAVQTVREFEPGDKITELTGMGGTVMKPAFDYMSEHFPDLAGIICFTDMEIYDLRHIVRPNVPVLWTIYTRSAEYYTRLAANAPFGDTIHVVE